MTFKVNQMPSTSILVLSCQFYFCAQGKKFYSHKYEKLLLLAKFVQNFNMRQNARFLLCCNTLSLQHKLLTPSFLHTSRENFKINRSIGELFIPHIFFFLGFEVPEAPLVDCYLLPSMNPIKENRRKLCSLITALK